MTGDARYSSTLTPVPGSRSYWGALAVLASVAVMVPFAYFVGPTTLVECRGTNPFDRFGLWMAQGSHVDGNELLTKACIAPHPVTWAAVCLIAATGAVLLVIALRRH